MGRLDNLIVIDLDSLDDRLGGNFTRSRVTFGLVPLDMIRLCYIQKFRLDGFQSV